MDNGFTPIDENSDRAKKKKSGKKFGDVEEEEKDVIKAYVD